MDTEAEDELAQGDFPLLFQGKYKLSMEVTPRRQYLATAGQDPYLRFTTEPAQALVVALYASSDAGVVLQVAAEPGAAPAPGQFVSIQGVADNVLGWTMADYRQATVFDAQPLQQQGLVRLRHRKAGRYLMARVAGQGVTLWLPGPGLFDDAPWRLDPVQLWNSKTMENADLRYVRGLKYLCKQGQSFASARLQQADFGGAKLNGCDFSKAHCEGAGFIGADIGGTDFTGTAIDGAQFGGARAKGAKFPGAKFKPAHFLERDGAPLFEGATLTGASFEKCRLDGTKFAGAQLDGAIFKEASLRGADLSGAALAGANFEGATADGATFIKSTLAGATLDKAALAGASFVDADLARASFAQARFVLQSGSGKPVDFTRAILHEIDFSGCDLRAATIPVRPEFHKDPAATPSDTTRRARFCGAHVPIGVIGTTNWRMLDLSGAKIYPEKALTTMKNFRAEYAHFPDGFELPDGIDLTGAKFNYASMVGIRLDAAVSEADLKDKSTIPDFTYADLRRARMSKAELDCAIFSHAIMHGINLSYAQLSYAKFDSARLDTAVVTEGSSEIILTADLTYTRLENANFSQAYLDRGTSSAQGANLAYAVFYGNEATVKEATLNGAVFNNAYLAGVKFNGAKAMEDIQFAGACLVACVFQGASMLRARLTGACLLGANFTEAKLDGASMSNAMLAAEQPAGAKESEKNLLTVKGVPGVGYQPLLYGRTVIETKATTERTTCQNGRNGPCEESGWKRVTGPQIWTYGK